MIIINPNEIGAKISTLIAESNDKFIAVSPYIDLSEWRKIIINLERAVNRGVVIDLYFRELKEKDFQILSDIGVNLFKIKGLHTKLYINENEVIVSSMNLYEFSDLYSIDIAMHFDENSEYNKIYDYFEKYISSKKEKQKYNSKKAKRNLKELHKYLTDRFLGHKINYTKSYLFSKNLNPIFDLFIESSKIGFKYPQKNPSPEKINELNQSLKEIFNERTIFREYNTTEKTKYCIWEIDMSKDDYLGFVNIICAAQKITNKSKFSTSNKSL